MSHFNNDFIKFFKELQKNNHKQWFDDNRKRYETSVKKPFYAFVEEMIFRINQRDPSVQIAAKDAVMRINRDIRFSPDKTPYNVHYGAIISSTGRKDKSVPGFFLRFSPKMIGVFGGAYGVDKHQLKRTRQYIADHLSEFESLITEKDFVNKFGTIKGEKHKRIPPEFQEAFQKQPLLANKQFYYVAELGPKLITSNQLEDTLMEYWETAKPLKDFLTKALA